MRQYDPVVHFFHGFVLSLTSLLSILLISSLLSPTSLSCRCYFLLVSAIDIIVRKFGHC